jgi:thiol:disulfide interchange protein DsbA
LLAALVLTSGLVSAADAPQPNWQEGVHYKRIEGVVAKPSATVQVVEVFGYFCPHCNHLEPAVEAWRDHGKADFINFTPMPVVWEEGTRQMARLYYTIVALNRKENLNLAAFNEVHVEHHVLWDKDPARAQALQAAFLAAHGVSAEEFLKAYRSTWVADSVATAERLTKEWRIQSVPTFTIAGAFTTDLTLAGSEEGLFQELNDVAARERLSAK